MLAPPGGARHVPARPLISSRWCPIMTYAVNPAIHRIEAPPIMEAQSWLRPGLRNRKLLNLCQAVPSWRLRRGTGREVARLAHEPGISLYTDIFGLPELREAIAAHISADYGGTVARAECLRHRGLQPGLLRRHDGDRQGGRQCDRAGSLFLQSHHVARHAGHRGALHSRHGAGRQPSAARRMRRSSSTPAPAPSCCARPTTRRAPSIRRR